MLGLMCVIAFGLPHKHRNAESFSRVSQATWLQTIIDDNFLHQSFVESIELLTAFCVSHRWLWPHNAVHTRSDGSDGKLEEERKNNEDGGAIRKDRPCKTTESVQKFQPYYSGFYCWTWGVSLVGKHDCTDLKSPSTSESSQMYSWGTFLRFRRCSSLLFCGEGYRKIISWTFQQKFMIRKKSTLF